MRPNFTQLANAYDRYQSMDTPALYKEIGWEDVIGKDAWNNTCAVRMSLALLHCGVPIIGRFAIHSGPLKGKRIEPVQNKLSDQLIRLLGEPEVFDHAEARKADYHALFGKTGIVSFMRIPDYVGGHIDVADYSSDWLCRRHCYFDASSIRFWSLS
ncbi:MAG: hypothetical protein JWL63_1570 [Rhodocyclales bacterium]|nr:hypothetical protein [Rhodocyclales bacterium]